MRWKTTAFLLVTTVAVGAYLSRYELRQPSPEERARLSKRVVDIQAADVSQLVLDLPNAKATFTRHGTAWTLTPKDARANVTLITQLLSRLEPLTAERVLSGTSEKSLDPKAFGLDPAAGWLSVVARGMPTTLLFGETTPLKGNRYLKVAERPEIFVVPSGLFEAANQPSEQFRDPLLLRFDPWEVEELAVASADTTFTLTRSGDVWRLSAVLSGVEPAGSAESLNDLADRAEVNVLLRDLSSLTIKRFVDDAPQVEQLPTWGFDHAKANVTLRQQDTSHAPVTLFFGKPLADDASLLFAKRSDEPPLYAVAAADVEALLRNPHGLRATHGFEFFTSQVTKLEVTREGTHWMAERTEHGWREGGAKAGLDPARVEAFLNELADVRVSGFVDDAPSDLARYGLEPPKGVLAVWPTESGEPQRLLVGTTIESSPSRYGRVEGRAAIVRLPELVTSLLEKTPDQLRPVATPPSAAGASPAPRAPSHSRPPQQ